MSSKMDRVIRVPGSADLMSDIERDWSGRWRRPSQYDFVADFGFVFESRLVTAKYRKGEQKQCFVNSQRLACYHPYELTYCEGFAILDDLHHMPHAWVCTEDGNVIDVTWPEEGVSAYVGVPISLSAVTKVMRERKRFDEILLRWMLDKTRITEDMLFISRGNITRVERSGAENDLCNHSHPPLRIASAWMVRQTNTHPTARTARGDHYRF